MGVARAVTAGVLQEDRAAVGSSPSDPHHPAVRGGQHGIAPAPGFQKINARVQATVTGPEGRQNPGPFQGEAKMDFERRVRGTPTGRRMEPGAGEGPGAGRQQQRGQNDVKGTG